MTMKTDVCHNTGKVAKVLTADNEESIRWIKPTVDCEKAISKLKTAVRETLKKQMSDAVNHPSHYTDGKIEVIDFIEDKKLGYHLGNVVKYVSRAGKKYADKEIEDLKKARWYLNRYIEKLESANEKEEV